ncbi:hypothetical protein BS47DRAFT_1363221 [Hydnum rufescens UP504]|uniref:C3H1-type domain-containing protein n=1 Tax=Hydnum rufescens UP504 TaxID=1448309 RepID=A0A9P6AUM4_9AGAM|nr:hypothetical protein BS47DRAFT_1363221 [Hydnum rufescens UP504]
MTTTATYTPMGDDPRARWNTLAKEQNDLFSYTLDRNTALETEISKLKDQIDLLQSGRTVMKEKYLKLENELNRLQEDKNVEVDLLRERQDQVVKSLQQQINDLKGYDPIAMCLIDGDGCIFSPQYLDKGHIGGEQAATRLKQELVRRVGGGATLCTFVLLELHWPSELSRKEAADAKIREMLRVFASVSQVKKIFFGGGHDAGYRAVLNSLRTDGLGDKVVVLDTGDNAKAIVDLDLNLISIPGLFLDKSMKAEPFVRPHEVKASSPLSPLITLSPVLPAAHSTTPTKWDADDQNTYSAKAAIPGTMNIAARTVVFPTLNKPKESQNRPKIDRTKQMTRRMCFFEMKAEPSLIHPLAHPEDPPLCNDYYLTTCHRSVDCPFFHEYDLTEDDIVRLRKDLKTMPCRGAPNSMCLILGAVDVLGWKCAGTVIDDCQPAPCLVASTIGCTFIEPA